MRFTAPKWQQVIPFVLGLIAGCGVLYLNTDYRCQYEVRELAAAIERAATRLDHIVDAVAIGAATEPQGLASKSDDQHNATELHPDTNMHAVSGPHLRTGKKIPDTPKPPQHPSPPLSRPSSAYGEAALDDCTGWSHQTGPPDQVAADPAGEINMCIQCLSAPLPITLQCVDQRPQRIIHNSLHKKKADPEKLIAQLLQGIPAVLFVDVGMLDGKLIKQLAE